MGTPKVINTGVNTFAVEVDGTRTVEFHFCRTRSATLGPQVTAWFKPAGATARTTTGHAYFGDMRADMLSRFGRTQETTP